jgi:hypothetical protein
MGGRFASFDKPLLRMFADWSKSIALLGATFTPLTKTKIKLFLSIPIPF